MAKIISLLVCLLLFSCSEQVQGPAMEIPEQLLREPQQQQAGKKIFYEHCRGCHGSLVEGRNQRAARFVPPAPDFHNSKYASLDPGYLYWRISEGKRADPFRRQGSVMPAWQPHLSKEQIWQLVAYLRQRAGGESNE